MESKHVIRQHALEFSPSEYASFQARLQSFRGTLNEKERQLVDILIPAEPPMEMMGGLPGGTDKDGAWKIDAKRIRNDDGTTLVCGPGYHAERVTLSEGGKIWMCVAD